MTVRSTRSPDTVSELGDTPNRGPQSWIPGYAWWLPLLIAAVAGALVYAVSSGDEDVFESEAILWVPPTVTAAPENYAQAITSDAVLADTIDVLRLESTIEELRAAIDIELDGTLIFLQGRATDPRGARILLDGVITRATDGDRPLVPGQPPPVVTSQPLDPREPVGDDAGRNAAIAVAISLAMGLVLTALVSGREYQRQPVLPIESLTRWPILGIVPREDGARVDGASAKSYNRLHRSLEQQRRRIGFRTLLVTGVGDNGDIADVALNIARSYGVSGLSTLIVDVNMDVPRLHQMTHVSNDQGLSDALRDDAYPPFGPLIATQDRLWIMPRGPAYAINAASLSTPQAARVLEGLPHAADIVILVGPSLEDATTTAMLASHCHAAVVTVGALFDDKIAMQQAARTLESPNIQVIGAVVTRASTRVSEQFRGTGAVPVGSSGATDGSSLGLASWPYQSTSAPQHEAFTQGSTAMPSGHVPRAPRDQP